MLYAQDSWSLLLVFQAMDAAGQDGTIKHHRYCLSWSALICPKFGRDAKFVRLLDQATDIVTNDFTQDFIDHRGISLAPEVIPELRLDH